MSHVCETLIFASILEDEPARDAEINAIVRQITGTEQTLRECTHPIHDRWYGGSKVWQGALWAGAINYLPIQEFLAQVATAVQWEYPTHVRLVLMDEDDDVPQLLAIGEAYNYERGKIA